MASEQEVQEKYLHLQLVAQTLKQVQQQLQLIDVQAEELEKVSTGLNDLTKVKEGSNLLVPISEGIFARAKLTDGKTLMVNVGGNVVIEKSVEDTRKIIDTRNIELREHREELKKQTHELMQAAQTLQEELSKLIIE